VTEQRGAIPERIRRAIYGLSRGRCYEPSCREPVVVVDGGEPVFVGEVAHIVGAVASGPRGAEEIDDREGFGNLLLLCGKHHKIIDDPRTRDRYPSELLREWKRQRERGIDAAIVSELSQIDDLAVRLPDLLVQAFAAVPAPTIQVGEGIPGIEAAFNEAYEAAGGSGDDVRDISHEHDLVPVNDQNGFIAVRCVAAAAAEDVQRSPDPFGDASASLTHRRRVAAPCDT
jgi:hypothetical protein